MKTIGKVIFAALIILIAFSCKKGDQLPKPTQTGADMMAAKINGKVWQKKACFSCIGGGSGLSVNYDNTYFFGVTGQNNDQKITVSIVIPELKATGSYELNSKIPINSYARVNDSNQNILFYTSNASKGTVIITKLDTNNKIISGTFEFTAEDESNPNNIIRVTEGRFDVKYN